MPQYDHNDRLHGGIMVIDFGPHSCRMPMGCYRLLKGESAMLKYSGSTNGFYDSSINTNIPADGVEITAEEHAALLAGQSQGKQIVADANGYPVLQDPPLPTLAESQTRAHASIDTEAGAARARYITVAPGQEATYLTKESQARAYKAAGYPSAAVANYPMVEAEALAIYGTTPAAADIQAACDGIIAQADAWITKAAEIERARIGGKRAVTAATTNEAVETARAVAVAELGAL
jgi:hypothetical protein